MIYAETTDKIQDHEGLQMNDSRTVREQSVRSEPATVKLFPFQSAS